ncbi:ABC transporter permease subunit [Bradyrhizobium diazoefficiens]|uniref:ABC transporter permease subunit n=1 Tax=Bradyrhizobium diazoefficiens TaxID=1355477 RepID=UPI00190D3BDE|nr:ABC transporter permease subunit [Bradyrhizobium diazoefficiens]MBK3661044.1 ABC transporter permease subunit [Bradyrhizobium diazoefficiens]
MRILNNLGRMPILLTVPAIAILLIAVGVPIVQLFLTSLNAPALSLVNYEAFFGDSANRRVLLQTIEISIIATLLCLIIGYPTAYLIAGASKKVRVVLTVLVFIPWLTSALVRTYAWVVILGDHGLINQSLLGLGLISHPLPLLYNRLAVYIGMVHIMLPIFILPLLSVMVGIDKSLMAAARSMGARPFAAFFRVYLPLSLPGVRSGVLLVFVICLGFYITPAALGGLRDVMLSNFIATQLSTSVNLAPVAASAFILLAAAAVALFIFGLDLSGGGSHGAIELTKRKRLQRARRVALWLNEFAAHHRAKRWRIELYRPAEVIHWSTPVGALFLTLVMLFLQVPGLIVIAMSFSPAAVLEFPPSGFSLRWYETFFADPSWTSALMVSLQIGLSVALVSASVGTLAAFGLNRTVTRVRSLLTMVILTPITFPIIVVGVVIYFGLVRLGLIGTISGVVIAHSVGAIAYVFVIVSATLANFDRRLEQAAMSMRAGPITTFRRVTVPLILPGIVGGAVFAFIHSFDEVIITSLVSGFSIRTLPLKMYENISNQIDPTIAAVGSLLTLLPALWLLVLYLTWWKSRSLAQNVRPESLA